MQEYEAEKADHHSEAEKVYLAAAAGGKNPAENIRQASKVLCGALARDGVITYNGVVFQCDEKTNSICLGDLAKTIGMFSPEDVKRILRAIAQDTKIQSMKQELEDIIC